MKLEKEEALIEAILFLESDPIDINTIIKNNRSVKRSCCRNSKKPQRKI